MSKKNALSEGFVRRMMTLSGVGPLSERFLKEEGGFPGAADDELDSPEMGDESGSEMPPASPELDSPDMGDDSVGDTDVDADSDTVEFGPDAIRDLAGNVANELARMLKDVASKASGAAAPGMGADDLGDVGAPPTDEFEEAAPGDDLGGASMDMGAEPGEAESEGEEFEEEEKEHKFEESLKKKLVEEIFKRVMRNLKK